MASRLLSALRKGHDTLLEALQEVGGLEELPEEDCGELGRCSLLIHAAYAGDCQAVETLVSHGADFRSLSGAGGSGSVGNCIDWLCWRQEPRVAQTLELLLARWAEQFSEAEVKTMLNTPRHLSRTPLMNAVFAPNVASTEVLLRHGADAAYAGEDGSCALDLAAQLGGSRGSKLVQMLLEAHADPNVGSIGPLFLAAQENSETSVKALLAAKARPGGLGFDGPGGKDREALTTPVECAARFGFLRVLKLLLAADGAPRGLDLKLALTLAQEAGHSDVERILLRAGAAPDAKRPADADALEEALLLPEGFVPGQADSEEVEGQIQVEEVDGSYRLRFPGPSHLTASSATPARMCAAHDSFYYEVLVEELDLLVALGFARQASTPLHTLPGWTKGTYGLHSDDGLLQANTATTRLLQGWVIKKGSTVGMGVEWSSEDEEYQLFVTLEGRRQARTVPLADDRSESFDLYPLVGADRPAVLLVNLGAFPFLYSDPRHLAALAKRKAARAESTAKKLKLREAQELHKQNRPDAAAWRFLSLAEAGHEVAQMNVAQLLDSGLDAQLG
ncbi:Ankyrin repeat and SOCS box protein 3 (ASB-3) [Durusdinium trenchii]|uniref:Ankyrin repeat and SOCS box protein 3 (ASB-3) n=1 Tax=Durusdinium trenchii TaxID=1381693 RepID=A0ABP0HC78_9DINO